MDSHHCKANAVNMEPLKISRRDFFRLPANLRNVSDGIKVMASVGNRQGFVPVQLIELPMRNKANIVGKRP